MKYLILNNLFKKFFEFIFYKRKLLWGILILLILVHFFHHFVILSYLGILICFLLIADNLFSCYDDFSEYKELSDATKKKLKMPYWLPLFHFTYPFICFIPLIYFLCGYSCKFLIISVISIFIRIIIQVYYDELNEDLVDSDKESKFY